MHWNERQSSILLIRNQLKFKKNSKKISLDACTTLDLTKHFLHVKKSGFKKQTRAF